jgi:nucleoside-specific outer membrane channel protein Tsx
MTTNIKEQIFLKSALYSTPNGRDYLKTPEGEIFSINGLYCDQDGNQDRWGSYVKIMDVRWTVVVWRDCAVGLNPDYSYKTERRLQFSGDNKDEEILAHYGYRMERDSEGYKNIFPKETK